MILRTKSKCNDSDDEHHLPVEFQSHWESLVTGSFGNGEASSTEDYLQSMIYGHLRWDSDIDDRADRLSIRFWPAEIA